jgi:hypothetical protein
VVQAPDKIPLVDPTRHGRVSRGRPEQLGLLKHRQLTIVAQKLTEPEVSGQVHVADATQQPQVRLEPRAQALRPVLMHVTTGILRLRMVDERMRLTCQGPIAAGRVGRESTPRVHRDSGGLLYRLHRKISGRLEDDSPLAVDPRDDRGPVFVVVTPSGLAFLAATPWLASPRVLPARLGWSLMAGGVGEVIGVDCPFQLMTELIRPGGMTSPLAPARAGADMDPSRPGHAARCTPQAPQEGAEHPVRQRPLALVQHRAGEIIEGALAVLAAGAVQARLVMVWAPGTDVVALTSGAWPRTVFPAQRINGGLTRFGGEALVYMRNTGQGCASPLITGSVQNRIGDSQLTIAFSRCYKLR